MSNEDRPHRLRASARYLLDFAEREDDGIKQHTMCEAAKQLNEMAAMLTPQHPLLADPVMDILGYNGSQNVDVVNIAYSVFNRAKTEGADWFNDTLPMVEKLSEQLRPRLEALRWKPMEFKHYNDKNLPTRHTMINTDWEIAEYVYRFLRPGSDGDRCHPDVATAARVAAKVRLRREAMDRECSSDEKDQTIKRLVGLLEEVKQRCLFSDDDAGIGVTENPVIESDLFDRVAAELKNHER